MQVSRRPISRGSTISPLTHGDFCLMDLSTTASSSTGPLKMRTLNPAAVRIGTGGNLTNQVEQLCRGGGKPNLVGQDWEDDVRVRAVPFRLAEGVALDDALPAKNPLPHSLGASPRHGPARIIRGHSDHSPDKIRQDRRTRGSRDISTAGRSRTRSAGNPRHWILFQDLPELKS